MYNDVNDTAAFSTINSTGIRTYATKDLTWVRDDFKQFEHRAEVTVVSDNPELFGDGKIKLKVSEIQSARGRQMCAVFVRF